jgi:hypothetical protein
MWNRRAVVAGVAAVALVAACSEAPPTEPIAVVPDAPSLFGGAPANPQAYDGALDSHFARIAQEVPGFAGFYRGEDGGLIVMMAEGTQAMSAAQAQRALGGHLTQMGVDLTAQPVSIQTAHYDYLTLQAVRAQVRQVMSIADVVLVDTDERANRVRIGASTETARASVEHALGMMGVDTEMVVVDHAYPIEAMQTLRDRVRPVGGGLQIVWPRGASWFVCTLGFNVRSPEAPGVQGFVTNSHCTTNLYGTGPTGTPYYQNLPPALGGVDTFVGTEVHDLPTFTGGACPAGRQCRWSDAAGVRYTSGVNNTLGLIYRTAAPISGPLEIGGTLNITAEQAFPFLGDPIHKVGRTTGWTQGNVTSSCTDTNVGGTPIPNLTLLCQEHVTGAANIVAGGDSGSPTFHPFPGGQLNTVRLNGILWGGGGPGNSIFVFSAMNEVRFENPPPAGRTWVTH